MAARLVLMKYMKRVCGIDYYQAVHSKLCSARRINLKENNYGKQGLYC